MNFFFGLQISLGVSDQGFCVNLSEQLGAYFHGKEYGKIQTIYCGVICVSEEFVPFFPVRPLKILRKEPAIEFEYSLDFERFKLMNQDERKKYIVHEYLHGLETIVMTKKIKGFDLPRLLVDLHLFFAESQLKK